MELPQETAVAWERVRPSRGSRVGCRYLKFRRRHACHYS